MTTFDSDHLGLDAIVAFTDGELSMVAFQRAAAHIERCPQCRAEVAEQQAARTYLRTAQAPTMPIGLFDNLRAIPVAFPLHAPAPGVSIDPATGRAYRAAEPHRQSPARGRRFRLGAGALAAVVALGVVVAAAASDHQPGDLFTPSGHLIPTDVRPADQVGFEGP